MPKQKTGTAQKADNKLLANLNEQQKQAVTFGDGPLLIIAGAGTGKTTVITRRIAELISRGAKPDEILALTFTDKAASEMEERVDLLLPYGYYDLWISTFHAFCERVLKQHALDIGISNDFKVLDTIQQKILVRKNFDLFNLDYYRPLGNPTKFIGELVKHFSKLKDEEINPEDYLRYAQELQSGAIEESGDTEEIKRIGEIANAYSVYQKLLLDNNALDFGDLINYALKLFRSRKKILDFYRAKFKFILVDEFQDTNFAQYDLVKLLSDPKNNLNVVGDDDQSIYKFRGASVSNIMQFKKDFPEAKEITLTENYRSSQGILDMAYNFIQANNPNRLEPALGINKKLKSNTKDKAEMEVISGQTSADEVDLVVNKILELKKRDKEFKWNDVAILVRANDQADPFISKLAGVGLPYMYYANKGLYKKPIILDLVYYLRVLVNHHEDSCLYRILNIEPFALDRVDLANLLHYAHKKTLSLFEAMQSSDAITNLKPDSFKKIRALLSLIEKHNDMAANKNVVEVFINVVKDLQVARRIDKDTIENMENREILEQFYRKIEAFEADNADRSVKNFLDILNFEQEAGEEGKLNFDPNQGPESVKIMTIHSSKGLEFKYVFVVGMVHLRFPSSDRKDAIEIPPALVKETVPEGDIHLQEERRLFYVAVTRAKRGLFFTYALDYGGARTRKPSPFLVDIGLVAKPEKSVEIIRKEQSIAHNYDPSLFLPNVFSYTQISDFLKCPMRYKYRHLLHLPLPGSASLSFGQTVHKTLELFLREYKTNLEMTQLDLFGKKGDKKLPSFEELEKLYERNWVDEWYASKKQKEEYRNVRGKAIIKAFYEHFEKDPVVPKYIEEKFNMKIGGYVFTGKIDRADFDQRDKMLHIVDYKTGQTKLDKKEDRQQLLIYQWAAQEYLKEKVGGLRYWYLLDNTFSESFVGTPQELNELKSYLLATIEKIRDAAATNNFKELDSHISHSCEFEELD